VLWPANLADMGEEAAPRLTPLGPEVLRAPGGLWRATCECGSESMHRDQTVAWEWLVSHPCLADIPAG